MQPTVDACQVTELLCELLSPVEYSRTGNPFELIPFIDVVALANQHFVNFSLYTLLQSNNLLGYLSETERLYLSDFHQLNEQRNNLMIDEITRLSRLLASHDIQAIFIKGGAALIEGWYSSVACRFLRDLDILIAPDQVKKAYQLLSDNGYAIADSAAYSLALAFDNENHQLPEMFHESSPVVVEIHKKPVSALCRDVLNYADVAQEARQFFLADAADAIYVPSATHSMMISVLHSEVSDNNRRHRMFNIRQALDVPYLVRLHGRAIDYSWIDSRLKSKGFDGVLPDYLGAISHFFNVQGLPFKARGANRRVQGIKRLLSNPNNLIDSARVFLSLLEEGFSEEQIKIRYKPESFLGLQFFRCVNVFRVLKKYSKIKSWQVTYKKMRGVLGL